MHDYEYHEEEPQGRPRDPAIDAAIERLRRFFDEAPRRLFYSTQTDRKAVAIPCFGMKPLASGDCRLKTGKYFQMHSPQSAMMTLASLCRSNMEDA